MATSALTKVTLAERLDLSEPLRASGLDGALSWPAFYEGSATSARFWERTYVEFAEFQVVFVDAAGAIVACGHTLPMYWDGTVDGLPNGWDAGVEAAFAAKRTPNSLMAVSAVAHPALKNAGLGTEILVAMRDLAAEHGFESVIAPVRPNLKEAYPLAKFEEYVGWTHPDGSAFDPWIRAHVKVGGQVLKIAPESMVVEGTVEQWRRWTGGTFPASGAYVVSGALAPVHVDLERDLGRYAEPNLWVLHHLADSTTP